MSEPPTGSPTAGAVSRSQVVVSIRRAECHPICLQGYRKLIVEGVTSVATVPGHVQSVVVGLRFNGHVVVLGPQPLPARFNLHFHAQTTTYETYTASRYRCRPINADFFGCPTVVSSGWWSGVVVSALASINEVNQRRARLVLRWVTLR